MFYLVVFRYMKNVSGPVTFAEDGSAIDVELRITNLNSKRKWKTVNDNSNHM